MEPLHVWPLSVATSAQLQRILRQSATFPLPVSTRAGLRAEACSALLNLRAGLDSLGFSSTQVGVLNWRVYDLLLAVQLEAIKSYDSMINFFETERTQYTLARVQQGLLSSELAGVGSDISSQLSALRTQSSGQFTSLRDTLDGQFTALTNNIQAQTTTLATAIGDQTRTLVSQSAAESNALKSQIEQVGTTLEGECATPDVARSDVLTLFFR